MPSKNKKPKKEIKIPEGLKSVGRFVEKVFERAATHPASLGLAVMAGSAIISTVASLSDPDISNARTKEVRAQMAGLYNGAQTLTVAAALAPILQSGLQTVQAFAPVPKQ